MNEYEKSRIHTFAVRYKNLYEVLSKETPALYDDFAANLARYGFSKDRYEGSLHEYLTQGCEDKEEFERVLAEENEIVMLGDAVFARWYALISAKTESLLEEHNRLWMILALSRMIELSYSEKRFAWDFDSAPESVKIISRIMIPSDHTENEAETKQQLSIDSEGKVSLIRWQYLSAQRKEKIAERKTVHITVEQAELLLAEISSCFAKEGFEMIGLSDPQYEITLTSQNKREY
ncbi:MAG: hypothetical protein IKG55_06935, partial [Solobacterium sp.]|nr:hypothetical protein [Solobacterium sp.]